MVRQILAAVSRFEKASIETLALCVTRVHRETLNTPPLPPLGCAPFRMDQGYIRGDIARQGRLMPPTDGVPIGPPRQPLHRDGRVPHVGPLQPHAAPTRAPRWRTVAWPGGLPRARCHAAGERRVLPTAMCAAIRVAQGRVGAGAQPHKRCAPVARERTRILGGRSCAYVPGPFRVLARRRGGSGGSGGGVLVCPRVLGQRVGFDGGADHDRRRCRLVAVGLNPPPEGGSC